MGRRMTLRAQVFLAIALVALGTALAVGLTTRLVLASSFDAYLANYELDSCLNPSETATSTVAVAGYRGGGQGTGTGTSVSGGQGSSTGTGTGQGYGRRALGAAEQKFLSSVDLWVGVAAVAALAVAIVVSLLLARRLSRPLHDLELVADGLTRGDLTRRAPVRGPVEVASLGETFNAMADSIQRAEELRKRLVSDVAHELRNPLAAARGQAEGIADGILPADSAHLDSVLEDLEHLSVLIDDLHDLSVADSGQMRYDVRELDLSALARDEAAHALGLLGPEVDLVVDVPDGLTVNADPRRLAQVMRNLLTNAARHTASGTVTVTGERTAAGLATITVRDTGSGIAPEDLPFVFERFYRADSVRASVTGGAGLGLAISRAIIHDHGGEVFAESELGSGSAMGFSIPAL